MKTINRFLNIPSVFFLVLLYSLTVPAIAQIPDYNLSKNWMCHPVLLPMDVARQYDLKLTVLNADKSHKFDTVYPHYTDTLVDIFYVYPTIDMDLAHGNTAMEDINTAVAQFVYREQVGIYAQFGRVFAPYYRQAKIGVFLQWPLRNDSLSAQAAYMIKAYKDVEAAFDHYLKYYNKGHKIILMGHSQGSDMTRFLLHRRFDNNPVLQSQLVVALSGGEPNYAAKGSRTGGSLEKIKILDSKLPLESGCLISWRTWKNGYTGAALDSASFFYNHYLADGGLLYQTYDTINHRHQESNYDFGYDTLNVNPKLVTRYISLSPDSVQYWGFDDMFSAYFSSELNKPGCTYLKIDSMPVANDLRKIPNPLENDPHNPLNPLFPSIPIPYRSSFSGSLNTNYHCWDMQLIQGDLLNLLPQLIAITNPVTSVPKAVESENAIHIYPNPATDKVHVNNVNSKIKSIKLYNLQGNLVQEFFTNDFSVSSLKKGIYFIRIQTNKSTYKGKLEKE